MKRSLVVIFFLALLIPERSFGVTLLITNPLEDELHNIATLAERGMLKVPDLRLVGIYHADEHHDYSRAERYIKRNRKSWMEMKALSCPLGLKDAHKENACTPEFKKLLDSADGIIFTGGSDMPPGLYGEKISLLTVVKTPPRHFLEHSLMFHLLGSKRNPRFKPYLATRTEFFVLGICKGMQTMNVATGGSLVQDIPSEIYKKRFVEQVVSMPDAKVHKNYHTALDPAPWVSYYKFHAIRLARGKSGIAKALGEVPGPYQVISAHHQAVEKTGKGLQVLFTSMDRKVVEGLAHKKYKNVLGVQFHPENTILFDETLDERMRATDPRGNYIASQYAADENIQAFHQAFWKLVSERLIQSANARND